MKITKAIINIYNHKDFDIPKKSFENSVVKNVINSVNTKENGVNQSFVFLKF